MYTTSDEELQEIMSSIDSLIALNEDLTYKNKHQYAVNKTSFSTLFVISTIYATAVISCLMILKKQQNTAFAIKNEEVYLLILSAAFSNSFIP